MKLIKYITGSLLFCLLFVFIGEVYVWNTDNFEENYPYVTFYLQKNTTKDEMLYDIQTTAEKRSVDVFVVDSTVRSLFSMNTEIYISNKHAQDYLMEESEIKQGAFRSIFLGKINISFHNWNDIPDISKIEKYYVIGDDEDIINFKKDLVDKYAGRFPQEGYSPINSVLNVMVRWGCIFIFLLLLTLYEVLLQKKNVLLKIIMGKQIGHIIFENAFCDIVVYCSVFILLMCTLSHYTNVLYLAKISFTMFALFLTVNTIIYLNWFLVDYRKDIHSQDRAQRNLKVSYGYKVLMSLMLIFIMSGCMELIFEGVNFYRQKNFFSERQDFYYITVGGDFNKARQMLNKYYTQGRKENKETGIVDLGKWLTDAEYLYADQGMLDYICSNVPDMKGRIFESKIYYLVPQELYSKDICEDMMDICFAYLKEEYEYEIIEYTQTAWIMAISNTGQIDSSLKKNPIIIFNNIEDFEMPMESILYIGNSSMYRFSDEEFEDMAVMNSFQDVHYRTNVYDNYRYHWNIIKRSMALGCVLLAILLVLEGLILINILKYEYQISAKELLLNKIQGNSFFDRHKRLMVALMSGWLSLLSTVFICFLSGFSAIIYIVAGGVLILVVEHLFAILYSHKLDNANIIRIFKGGIL